MEVTDIMKNFEQQASSGVTLRYRELLKKYITENCKLMKREPAGILKHPYTVPCAPGGLYYFAALWDWDSWLISIALAQVEIDCGNGGENSEFIEYEKGCILNFLEHTPENGAMPINITPDGMMHRYKDREYSPFDTNIHKPVIMQHAAALIKREGSTAWIAPYLGKIEVFINNYLTHYMNEKTGLAVWRDDFAVGVDNDPSIFYRPTDSCGHIYLNCLLYKELLAYAYVLEISGDEKASVRWKKRAAQLADAINEHCWDERDGTYYSVDHNLQKIDTVDWLHGGAPRNWDCVIMRIDSWCSFMPLWAGLADAEKARRMAARATDDRTFAARYGIRTLSRLEKMYSLSASNNPSNWLGSIWGISNYMVFKGLEKYGFTEEAKTLAEKTVQLFGRDIERNGCLHEFYHPDSGEPIMTPGFQNWNFLVLNMIAWLEGRKSAEEF